MEELIVEQQLDKYPYLRNLEKTILFITKSKDEFYKNGPQIIVDGRPISIDLLFDLFENDKYYNYTKNLFDDKMDLFTMRIIMQGDIAGGVKLTRKEIIYGIDGLLKAGYELTDSSLQRYNEVYEKCAFDNFIQKNKRKKYYIEVDGIEYRISGSDIIKFLKMSDEDFEQLCNTEYGYLINKIPKEHMAYIACEWLHDNKAFTNYVVSPEIDDRYREICSSDKIDIEAINKVANNKDDNLDKVTLNEDFRKLILGNMPNDFNDLEKAIYIYIKMCRSLTYDEEYFAVNQRGPATEKHKDINYISSITPENNKVVCFEFNLIYGKFLDELGITFSSSYQSVLDEVYGEGHTSLLFRTDKFWVRADSVTSILSGDIARAKTNHPIVGLVCNNSNKKTTQEFSDTLQNIYNFILRQDVGLEHNNAGSKESFEEILKQYKDITSVESNVTLEEKMDIMVRKVNDSKLVGVDSLSYILQLEKILFDEIQREENINITVFRNNNLRNEEKTTGASAMIVLNHDNIKTNPYGNSYYLYTPNANVIPMTQEEVQIMFNNQTFGYIGKEGMKISGIDNFGGPRR